MKNSFFVEETTQLLKTLFKNEKRNFIIQDEFSNEKVSFKIKESNKYVPTLTINEIEYILVTTAPENVKQFTPTIPIFCTEKQIKLWVNGAILPIKEKANERKNHFPGKSFALHKLRF